MEDELKMISKRKLLSVLMSLALALPVIAQQAESSNDSKVQQEVEKQVKKGGDRLKNVTATVHNGDVALNGSVDRLYDKLNLERKIARIKGVDGVHDHIQVSGNVSDEQLKKTLADKLRYDRAGYGLVWNTLNLDVQNGVVTLSGLVREPVDKDSAMAIVENTPGVKAINDELDVAPASPFDDDIRARVAQAIYGYGPLQRYALDPQRPIRIAVANGHVALYGVVDNKMDSQLAETRANQVPNVFSVENHLIVANEGGKKK
jgi:osmotically-inducible protein OsmY